MLTYEPSDKGGQSSADAIQASGGVGLHAGVGGAEGGGGGQAGRKGCGEEKLV